MKLIQLNVWGGRLESSIYRLVEHEKPDILCWQEAIDFAGEVYSFFGTLKAFKLRFPEYKYIYYSPGIRFKFMNKNAEWGNCIVSRYKIAEKSTHWTHLSFINNFNFDDYDYNAHNFQHCVIEAAGRKLHVLNHHGYHIPDHKNGNEETLEQMKQIRQYVDKLGGPVVLAGDFNLAPHSKSLEVINRRLTNLSLKYKLRTTRTVLSSKTEVCDYIFVNDKIKVNYFSTSKTLVSDHVALIVEFELV